MTPEQLISKGPTPEKEVAAAALATAAQTSAEHKMDATSTKNVLAAFDSISNKNETVDEGNLKKILDEEEAKTDDSATAKLPEDGDEEPEELPKDSAKEEPKKEEVKLPPTARPKGTDELKGIVPDTALPLLKKMSNDAREYFVAEFKRYGKEVEELKSKLAVSEKQTKSDLPTGWYEHEDAYSLTPEFKNLAQTKGQLGAIEDHYRKQLIAIKEGEDWFDLTLDNRGQIVQQKRKAGAEADMLVSSRLQEAVLTLRDLEKQELALKQSFKQNVVNHRSGMKKLEDEYFPQYADEKEFSAIEDVQSFQKVLQSYGLQNDRMSGITSKLYAYALDQTRKVQELEKAKNVAATNKPVVNKNGPTGDEINKGSVTKVVTPDEVPFNPRAFDEYFK